MLSLLLKAYLESLMISQEVKAKKILPHQKENFSAVAFFY